MSFQTVVKNGLHMEADHLKVGPYLTMDFRPWPAPEPMTNDQVNGCLKGVGKICFIIT